MKAIALDYVSGLFVLVFTMLFQNVKNIDCGIEYESVWYYFIMAYIFIINHYYIYFFSTRPYENMLAFFINAFSMHSIGIICRAFRTNKNFAWSLSLKNIRLKLVVRQYTNHQTNYYLNTNHTRHTILPTCKMTISQQLL